MENTKFGETLETAVSDRIQDAINRVGQRKRVLGELTQPSDSISVAGRVEQLASRPDSTEMPGKNNEKGKTGTMADVAKAINRNSQRMKDEGVVTPTSAQRDNDGKSKDQEKQKEHKKEEIRSQQDEKMKKYANISLPGGLTIKEEAGQWKLYNKDGKSVDITDTMETIRQQNGKINEANDRIDQQNELAGTPRIPTDDRAISDEAKVNIVSTVLSNEDVKRDVFGDLAPDITPEAIKDISRVGIDYAEDKRLLDMLKDPNQADRALQELEDKEKRNSNRTKKEMSRPTPTRTMDRGGR